jgi:hypothetical protein
MLYASSFAALLLVPREVRILPENYLEMKSAATKVLCNSSWIAVKSNVSELVKAYMRFLPSVNVYEPNLSESQIVTWKIPYRTVFRELSQALLKVVDCFIAPFYVFSANIYFARSSLFLCIGVPA